MLKKKTFRLSFFKTITYSVWVMVLHKENQRQRSPTKPESTSNQQKNYSVNILKKPKIGPNFIEKISTEN
jgi:hypothetical protein